MNQPTREALRAIVPIQSHADQYGLVCSKCGCRHFLVVYTRRAVGGQVIRRRACRHCGERITTAESRLS